MRLNKFISETGLCSRREADALIERGKVYINGRRAELGTQVEDGDEVRVNGNLVGARELKHVYLALNKPVGIVCTTDRSERDNILDHVRYPQRIFPIGRLDKDSEGLILLTSNGDIVNELLRSEHNHEKEYLVTVDRPLNDRFIVGMAEGVRLADLNEVTKRCRVAAVNAKTFRIVLTQGLNRQIRRMCEAFGYEVLRLQRVRFVNVQLGNLGPGCWRDLEPQELRGLLPERRRAPQAAAKPAPRGKAGAGRRPQARRR